MMAAARRLERALVSSAARAGAPIAIVSHASAEWRSVTFAGERHMVEASAAAGAALDRWLETLGEIDLAVPGHLVADLRLRARDHAGARTSFRLEGVTVALDS